MRMLSAVTTLNVLVSLGFALAGLVRPEAILPAGMAVTEAAATFALYAAVRSLVLVGFVVGAVVKGNAQALRLLGALAGMVQLFDAGVGIYQHDMGKTIGPAIIAALQAWALLGSSRSEADNAQSDYLK